MDKKTARKIMREKRRAMAAEQVEAASNALVEALFAHPAYQAANSIYAYLSYNKEVRTEKLIMRAISGGKRVAVPKVVGDEMIFLWLDDMGKVETGYKGIPELPGGEEADDETALVITPGLAFDEKGYRCGYGGGFYDKYFAKHPQHTKIALCFDFQLVDTLKTDEFDVPVDWVISQKI